MKHMNIEKKIKNSEEKGKSFISFLLNSAHNGTQNITEGLKRQHAGGADIFAGEQRLKGFQYRGIGGLGQQTEQAALTLEQAAQNTRDRKCPVRVRNWRENLARKLFGKENRAFGLTAGAEIPCAAGKCQQMLLAAFRAANARETSLKPPAGRQRDLGTKRNVYAKYGVREYWIIDPESKIVEILSWPKDGYRTAAVVAETDMLSTGLFPGMKLDLAPIFR